ncbi:MAG: hypothetical protein LBI60_02090 [Bacteroidales bacterium]|jgi:hypothetical protein|nr:hypothetical protein [Bacteroidales bacterium]
MKKKTKKMGEEGDENKESCFQKVKEVITFLSELVTIVGIGFAYIAYKGMGKEQSDRKQDRIENIKEKAANAFDDQEWDDAFNLYMDLKIELPNDTTGYEKFLYKAIKNNENRNKDSLTIVYFTKAKRLHPTPEQNAANDTLKKWGK